MSEVQGLAVRIQTIYGQEPVREGEYPDGMWIGMDLFRMGHGNTKITRIDIEEDNLGTYGIKWFVGYDENGAVVKKMNALFVATIIYDPVKADD